MNKRFRASYKIAVGFAILALLGVYGYRFANDYLLGREHFRPLIPGRVNIVGLDTAAGYAVLVQNRAAKLVIGEGGSFGPGEMDEKSLERSESEKKFIPLKEMLRGLRGDVDGLSYFVERLNDITDEKLHSDAPVWKIEDIEAALSGDSALRKKLEENLNVTVDGKPLDHVVRSVIQNGITVDVPVPMQIGHGVSAKTVTARVKRPFQTKLMQDVEERVNSKFAQDNQSIAAQYAAAVAAYHGEDVARELRDFAKDGARLASFPQRVLNSIEPIINEGQITAATYRTQQTPDGDRYTLVISLSDEGRKRLWQFSRDRVKDQLLVMVDGVAVAAPFIQHGLSGSEVEIAGLQDESLAQLVVNTISERAQTNK